MTIRFTENDLGTSANNIVALDSNGKLPAIDGSLLTNVSGKASNGSILSYNKQSTTTFTADVDNYYWLYKADVLPANETGSSTYSITLPSINISIGSKVVFETFTRRPWNFNLNTWSTQSVSKLQSSAYTITVPSSSGTAYNSFKMVVKGVVYTEGQTYNSLGLGQNRYTALYAYIDGSNNVTWVDFKGNLNQMDDLYNFDIGNTFPILPERPYQLMGDDTTKVFYNVPLWGHLQITGNTTLAWGTNLNPLYKRYLITVNTATTPTITLPLLSTHTQYLLVFKVLPNFKNTTLSSVAGRTKTSGFTLQRQGTDVLSWSANQTTQTSYTSFTAATSTFVDATSCYNNNIYVFVGGGMYRAFTSSAY
jgi:hypothetical protein